MTSGTVHYSNSQFSMYDLTFQPSNPSQLDTPSLRPDHRYEFDSTTNAGRFDASLQRGTLAVVSGRLAKQSADAMTVRTPTAILGVRGTEFVVSVQ